MPSVYLAVVGLEHYNHPYKDSYGVKVKRKDYYGSLNYQVFHKTGSQVGTLGEALYKIRRDRIKEILDEDYILITKSIFTSCFPDSDSLERWFLNAGISAELDDEDDNFMLIELPYSFDRKLFDSVSFDKIQLTCLYDDEAAEAMSEYKKLNPKGTQSLAKKLDGEVKVLNGCVTIDRSQSLGDSTTFTLGTSTSYLHTTSNGNDIKNNKENKGDLKLNTQSLFKDLQFGKANSNIFKLSLNGIAVRDAGGSYQVWDPKANTLVDVAGLTFDFDALYVMPSNEIKVGDIVLHRGKAVYVTEYKDGVATGVDYSTGTIITIPAIKNIFGFTFFSKVISLFGDLGAGGGDNMFGGDMFKNPMMLMMLMGDGKGLGGGSNDFMQMMLLSQMGGSLFGQKK